LPTSGALELPSSIRQRVDQSDGCAWAADAEMVANATELAASKRNSFI
jgi:hypothetical protein